MPTTSTLTDEQLQQTVDALAAHGSECAAARALGIGRSAVQNRRAIAERKGFTAKVQMLVAGANASPPEGYKLKGTSTLYDEHGVARLQWVKTDAAERHAPLPTHA